MASTVYPENAIQVTLEKEGIMVHVLNDGTIECGGESIQILGCHISLPDFWNLFSKQDQNQKLTNQICLLIYTKINKLCWEPML